MNKHDILSNLLEKTADEDAIRKRIDILKEKSKNYRDKGDFKKSKEIEKEIATAMNSMFEIVKTKIETN